MSFQLENDILTAIAEHLRAAALPAIIESWELSGHEVLYIALQNHLELDADNGRFVVTPKSTADEEWSASMADPDAITKLIAYLKAEAKLRYGSLHS